MPRRSSPHFSVILIPRGWGIAIIIPKKLHRRAVDRHRLKRRIAAILSGRPALALPPSFVLYPKAGALALPSQSMREELATLLTPRAPVR